MSENIHPSILIGWDLVGAVRKARDQENIQSVYQRVFANDDGRAVLIDLMARSGMMERRPPSMSASERFHADGMASLMIEVLDLAGVDVYERSAALQAATALDSHMERAHGPDFSRGGYDRSAGNEPNRSDLDSVTDPFADD
ncbi:hypothetical protein [Asticcacaulis excentricus]|uniref:Bbp19-like phage domain-containing protein n=1 Tax=Asticcacaulis excentricus TaxID=78587 RepID=A0A3G9G4M8_9CAUL|nr:hypothetical protein [Asticcacaulis excentricus]BBF79914.1 hypothetical protein EM6_0491 [Asticcacaulis excentricus]